MAFKTVKKITNPKKKKGDQTLGKLYPTNGKTKVFVRREWRGVKHSQPPDESTLSVLEEFDRYYLSYSAHQ